MALINCRSCGHRVSDKAKVCPRCGAQVVVDELVSPGNDIKVEEALQPQQVPPIEKPKHKSNVGFIVALAIIAVLSGGGWLWYDCEQKQAEQERQHALFAEQARQDSIAAAELREHLRQDSITKAQKQEQINTIYNEYIRVLKQFEEDWYNKFFLFDITKDGIPELWVDGIHPNDDSSDYQGFFIYVYTIHDQKVLRIFNDYTCAIGFYHADDYILCENESHEYYSVNKITYNDGSIESKVIREAFLYDDNTPPKKISETRISEKGVRDFEELKTQIQTFFHD